MVGPLGTFGDCLRGGVCLVALKSLNKLKSNAAGLFGRFRHGNEQYTYLADVLHQFKWLTLKVTAVEFHEVRSPKTHVRNVKSFVAEIYEA